MSSRACFSWPLLNPMMTFESSTTIVGVPMLRHFAVSSSRAWASVATSLAVNSIPLAERNSFALWQGGQPGLV